MNEPTSNPVAVNPWASATPIPDKRGYAVLSLDFLRSILRLPEGVKVKWVLMDPNAHQCRLYLEGPGLPSGCIVSEGDPLPVVALLYSAYAPTRIVA